MTIGPAPERGSAAEEFSFGAQLRGRAPFKLVAAIALCRHSSGLQRCPIHASSTQSMVLFVHVNGIGALYVMCGVSAGKACEGQQSGLSCFVIPPGSYVFVLVSRHAERTYSAGCNSAKDVGSRRDAGIWTALE
jgi:hypothetical protein